MDNTGERLAHSGRRYNTSTNLPGNLFLKENCFLAYVQQCPHYCTPAAVTTTMLSAAPCITPHHTRSFIYLGVRLEIMSLARTKEAKSPSLGQKSTKMALFFAAAVAPGGKAQCAICGTRVDEHIPTGYHADAGAREAPR